MRKQTRNYKSTALFVLITALMLAAVPALATNTSAIESEIADAALELKVKTALLEHIGWDMLTVDVEAEQGQVVLMGTADNRANQELAKEVTLAVNGVEKVDNKLAIEKEDTETPVGGAVANAELEVKDAVLESRVKTELITELGMDAFDIEVEATDGRVSLRGELDDQSHRTLALKAVESCKGVDEVVDLLSIAS